MHSKNNSFINFTLDRKNAMIYDYVNCTGLQLNTAIRHIQGFFPCNSFLGDICIAISVSLKIFASVLCAKHPAICYSVLWGKTCDFWGGRFIFGGRNTGIPWQICIRAKNPDMKPQHLDKGMIFIKRKYIAIN